MRGRRNRKEVGEGGEGEEEANSEHLERRSGIGREWTEREREEKKSNREKREEGGKQPLL